MLIVAAADPNDTACKAVIEAVARLRRDTDRVIVVQVATAPLNWYNSPSSLRRQSQQRKDELERDLRQCAHDSGLRGVDVEVLFGESNNVGDDICSLVEREAADLIVIGTRGSSVWRGLFMGSVAERVVRHASCDVYVVRTNRPEAP